MQNKELTVQTPLGELAVGINADPDYPGISVAFRGDGMNDCFHVGSIWLAWVEYSPEKHCLQAVVYGDGNADDYGTSDDCTEKAFGCGSSLLVNRLMRCYSTSASFNTRREVRWPSSMGMVRSSISRDTSPS